MKCPGCDSELPDGYGIKHCGECLTTTVVTSNKTTTKNRPIVQLDRSLWSPTPVKEKNSVPLDAEMAGLFSEVFEDMDNSPVDKTKEHCSFCGKEVDASRATRGSGKLKVVTTTVPVTTEDGEVEIEERTRVQAKQLVACPDCCLNIKPRVSKDGKVTNTLKMAHRV